VKFCFYLLFILFSSLVFVNAKDVVSVEYFHVGKMESYNKNFTLYFKPRQKPILAKGEDSNYVNDFPQDLYIYNNKTKKDKPLITYEWFPSKARKLIDDYNFPVFPEDFAYYLLSDNNTLVMVSAMKNVKQNLLFDIQKKELKKYNNKGKLDFIISTFAKKCGYSDIDSKYKCNLFRPLISNNLIN